MKKYKFKNNRLIDEQGKKLNEKFNELTFLKDENEKILFKKQYNFLLEDTGKTYNINMHSYSCFAYCFEEAYGKMLLNRPEFVGRKIESVTIDL